MKIQRNLLLIELLNINLYKAPRDKLMCLVKACKILFNILYLIATLSQILNFIFHPNPQLNLWKKANLTPLKNCLNNYLNVDIHCNLNTPLLINLNSKGEKKIMGQKENFFLDLLHTVFLWALQFCLELLILKKIPRFFLTITCATATL